MKCVQIRSFFWSMFSHIWTEYWEILRIYPCSVQVRESTDHKKLRIWTLSRNVTNLFHFKIKYILSYDCVSLFSWSFFKNPREICVFYGLSIRNPIEIRDTPKSMGDLWEKIKFREPPSESGRVEKYVFLFLTFQYLQICCDQMIFMWNMFYQSIF